MNINNQSRQACKFAAKRQPCIFTTSTALYAFANYQVTQLSRIHICNYLCQNPWALKEVSRSEAKKESSFSPKKTPTLI